VRINDLDILPIFFKSSLDNLFFLLIALAIKFTLSSEPIENGISSNLPWIFCHSSWVFLPKADAYSSKG
jgi:hypothetical protein